MPQKLKKPIEKIRAELLEDADTKRIARAMGMELEPYVEMVLDYLQHPEKEPVLKVASDEELRAAGYEPPTVEEIGNFFLAGARGELGLGGPDLNKSGFDSGPTTAGKPSLQGTEGQQQLRSDDPEKQKQLLEQMRKGGTGRV
jgi:hypothetical protein